MAYYKDLNIYFDIQNSGDIKADIDEDAVVNSINNIISTMQGSRRMLPAFANSVHKLLFEPLDNETASFIKEIMLEEIIKWDDRVIIKKITVQPDYDGNRYDVKLDFQISNIGSLSIQKSLFKY